MEWLSIVMWPYARALNWPELIDVSIHVSSCVQPNQSSTRFTRSLARDQPLPVHMCVCATHPFRFGSAVPTFDLLEVPFECSRWLVHGYFLKRMQAAFHKLSSYGTGWSFGGQRHRFQEIASSQLMVYAFILFDSWVICKARPSCHQQRAGVEVHRLYRTQDRSRQTPQGSVFLSIVSTLFSPLEFNLLHVLQVVRIWLAPKGFRKKEVASSRGMQVKHQQQWLQSHTTWFAKRSYSCRISKRCIRLTKSRHRFCWEPTLPWAFAFGICFAREVPRHWTCQAKTWQWLLRIQIERRVQEKWHIEMAEKFGWKYVKTPFVLGKDLRNV